MLSWLVGIHPPSTKSSWKGFRKLTWNVGELSVTRVASTGMLLSWSHQMAYHTLVPALRERFSYWSSSRLRVSLSNTLSPTLNSNALLLASAYFFIHREALTKLFVACANKFCLPRANLSTTRHLASLTCLAFLWGVSGCCPITNSARLILIA